MAAGVLLPPGSGGSRRRDFGEMPTFYDVWIKPGKEGWDNIMPVSGNSLSSAQHSPDKDFEDSARLSPEDDESPSPPPPPSRVGQLLRNPFTRQRNSPLPSYTPSPILGSEFVSDDRKLQISVLVAMPTPDTKESSNADDQVVPDVVFGVVQVPFKDEQPQQDS